MDIKQTITVINQMVADGIIKHYAIGGAVGATFYLEPVATLDVDIFIAFQTDPEISSQIRNRFLIILRRAVEKWRANIS